MSIDIRPVHGLSAIHPRQPETSADTSASPRPAQAAQTDGGIAVDAGTQLTSAAPPIDTGRVEEIRKALETDSYPILPTRIADAMIAARLMLSTSA